MLDGLDPDQFPSSVWYAAEQNGTEAYLACIGLMKPINQKHNYGWMAIELSLSYLQTEIAALNDTQNSFSMLLDADGEALLSAGNPSSLSLEDYQKLYQECSQEHESGTFLYHSEEYGKWIVSCTPLEYGEMTYFSLIPVANVMESVDQMRSFFVLMCLIVLLILECSIFLFIYLVYRPIFALLHEMQKFEKGDFSTHLVHHQDDEIRYIYDQYNAMVQNIVHLIQDRYEQVALKQQAEIKILQNQIDQHFLYNTLESIHWLCLKKDSETAAVFTMKLSMFYRLFLSSGQELVPIRDIVKMLQNYCDIILLRHGSKFRISLSCDPELMEARAYKYIFQPIVENAILHGVEQRIDGGEIRIQFQQRNDRIRFTVQDNGPGIPQDLLEKLNQPPEEAMKMERDNFALQCIKYQMKLFYQNDYFFHIESQTAIGTTVMIEIPKR